MRDLNIVRSGSGSGPSVLRSIGRTGRLFTALALVVVGAVGCSSDKADSSAESSKAALNVAPKTTDFAVYAQNSATLRDRAAVTGGDVGVQLVGTGPFLETGYPLSLISDSKVDATRTVSAGKVLLTNRAKVGDLQATTIVNQGGSYTRQLAFPTAMPALPPTAPVTAGTAPLTVAMNTTSTASPGAYATVSVGYRGILRLRGGVYQVAALQLDNEARIEALAPVQIRIAGRVAALDRTWIGAATGVTLAAGDIRIEVSGKNGTTGALTATPIAASFGNDTTLKGVLLAPNGLLRTGQRAIFTGAYIARDIYVDIDSKVTFQAGIGPSGCLASCDDNNPCTTDTCSVGVCVNTVRPAGSSCADNDACNGAEACDATGHCLAGTPVTCTALDQCHTAGVCDTTTGNCSNPVAANGTTCNDGNACTKTDVCTAGVCGGTAYTCDDSLGCTADGCNGDGTCSNAVVTGCLIAGACVAEGTVNPANECEQCVGATNAKGWSPKASGTACNDGVLCTKDDVCNGAGVCGGTAYTCPPPSACRAGVCTGSGCDTSLLPNFCEIKGACIPAGTQNPANQCQVCLPSISTSDWSAKAAGTSCNDGNACTKGDVCTEGVCGGTVYSCEDGMTCTSDSCNGDGTCNHTIATGSCAINGACYADKAVNPSNSCQVCNAATPETWANKTDGTSCSNNCSHDGGVADGGMSTLDGGCGGSGTICIAGQCSGECIPGQAQCSGLVPQVCDLTGHWQNQSSCDDGNACTTDSCSVGICSHGLVEKGESCGNFGSGCSSNYGTCDGTGQCLCACNDPANPIMCNNQCYPICQGGKIFDPTDCSCKCPANPTINGAKFRVYYVEDTWHTHQCNSARWTVDINGVPISNATDTWGNAITPPLVDLNNASDGGSRETNFTFSAAEMQQAVNAGFPIVAHFKCIYSSCHTGVGMVDATDLVTGATLFQGHLESTVLSLDICHN
jgi:hypothetical protein